VNDYVEFPSIDLKESHTIALWYNPQESPAPQWDGVVAKSANSTFYMVRRRDTDLLRCGFYDEGNVEHFLDSATTFAVGTWYHVVYVYNYATGFQAIYVNGSEDVSTTITPVKVRTNTENFELGARTGVNLYSKIMLDEVRIYNRALTPTEIQDLYNGKRITNGLISEWGFEDDPCFGQTTYEFEDSTNQYYGLQNINDSWLALFNPKAKLLEYLILNQRPLGLEIVADHNENIHKIKFKLKKGTRIWLGELMHADHSRDTDNDGVPDIFEEEYDPSIVLDIDFDNEDETQNIAHDRSPNHNNGTIYGAKWVNGKVGRALDFDGVDDYIEVSYAESLKLPGTKFSILAWIKVPTTKTTTGYIINFRAVGNNPHIEFYVNYPSTGILGAHFLPADARGIWDVGINDGKWHFVALTSDGSTARAFLDGVECPGTISSSGAEGPWVWISIGRSQPGEFFEGIIDEIRIYNRALSEDEIKECYNLGKLKRVSVPRLVKKMGYAGW